MSKLIYPKEGIYKHCYTYLDNCEKKLNNTVNNSKFDIPDNFNYSNYLRKLNNKMISYLEKIRKIDNKIKNIDKNFELLAEELEKSAQAIDSVKIEKRDRMIL